MEMTREQAIAEHRKMWNWIADCIEKHKEIFDIAVLKCFYLSTLGKLKNLSVEKCFLCEYARNERNKKEEGTTCDYCPIKRADGNGCLGGIYYRVTTAESWKQQAEFARQIANLPERTDA